MFRITAGLSLVIAIMIVNSVRAENSGEITVFAAGSLREALGEIARNFGDVRGVEIRTEFGPSGRMRERIEHGERVDLFASADVGHAHTLVEQGRASVMAVFARNTLCVLAPDRLGSADAGIVDQLLDKATRLGVSPPKVDPLGDYTVALYDRIGHDRSGAASDLTA